MSTRLSSLIEPAELELLLGETNIVIVDLCQTALYQQIHVPGHYIYGRAFSRRPTIPGCCPPLLGLKRCCQVWGLIIKSKSFCMMMRAVDGLGDWLGHWIWWD